MIGISIHLICCALRPPPPPVEDRSVLYQRGVYHPDGFAREAKYGITTLVTTDEALKKYLDNVIKQLKGKQST